jgi:hypothetical protein
MNYRMLESRIRPCHKNRFVFPVSGKYANCDNSIVNKFLICIAFSVITFFTGCSPNTEGTLEIKGKIIDEFTKETIPGRTIILQGLVKNNDDLLPIDAAQLNTDSSGYFTYSFRKIKDANFYNFNLVGDSDYSYKTVILGLYELEKNAKYLTFTLNKLVGLTLKIQKTSITPFHDSLYLSVKSNEVDVNTLYPIKIDNFGITDSRYDYLPGLGLRWIGGTIKSTVKTRVLANKLTKIKWELVRNKQRKEFRDTITCKRDLTQTIYFTY